MAKILHITLFFFLLSSSTGFVLGRHHCQRMMNSTDGHVDSCADMGGCKKGCCSTEIEYFHLDQDQRMPQTGPALPVCPVAALPASVWVYEMPVTNEQFIEYLTYRPPIVLRDISVLFQVFLC